MKTALPIQNSIFFESDPTLLLSYISIGIKIPLEPSNPKQLTTLSLLLELMSRGTEKKSREAFQKEVEGLGGTISYNLNTQNILLSAQVIKENTFSIIELVREMLTQPLLSQEEFLRLKEETLASIRATKNSNIGLTKMLAINLLYQGTPLIEESVSLLNSIDYQALKDAYQKYFKKERFFFGVASPVDRTKLEKNILSLCQSFPSEDKPVPAYKSIAPMLPKDNENKIYLIHKPKTESSVIFFAQDGFAIEDPLKYALSLGNFGFGGEPLISRLFRIIRSENGWTYRIYSQYSQGSMGMSNQKSFFSILSTPSVEFSFKTILATYDMWKEYMDKGLSKEEIAIAKESLVNSYPLSFDSPVKRLSLRVASFMYNIHIDTDKEYAQKISHLTNNDIIDALKKKQSLNRWVIAVTIDKNIFEEQKNQYKKEKGTVPSWMNPVKIYTPEEVIE